jgi:hypothetical protein
LLLAVEAVVPDMLEVAVAQEAIALAQVPY